MLTESVTPKIPLGLDFYLTLGVIAVPVAMVVFTLLVMQVLMHRDLASDRMPTQEELDDQARMVAEMRERDRAAMREATARDVRAAREARLAAEDARHARDAARERAAAERAARRERARARQAIASSPPPVLPDLPMHVMRAPDMPPLDGAEDHPPKMGR